jgi:hypothetical protein
MLYNQPLDQPTNPNASYVDGNPSAGIEGSIVPAASLELDQREVVEVIYRAFNRGYVDFSGTACGAPSNADLQQLRKAIEGFITNVEYFIDTDVTFTVHGPGAQFTDLNAAMEHLSKYKILRNGSVTLQIAGAASGVAQQFVYTQSVLLAHPNSEKITVRGAPLIGAPPNDTNFAPSGIGYSQANANADLSMLRHTLGTELHFTNGSSIAVYNNFTIIDLLITGDGSNVGSAGIVFTGGLPWIRDTAVHGFGSHGIMINEAYLVSGGNWVSSSGNVWSGFELQGDLYFPTPVISASNQQEGLIVTTGTSLKGGYVTCKGNGGDGMGITCAQVNTQCKMLNNGLMGINTVGSILRVANSTFSGNTSYAIYANDGSNVQTIGSSISGVLNPAANTIGNNNSLIIH